MISVIVPVYNVEPFIREALDSLVSQSFRDLEIILVDDGSPDGSGAICDEYAARDNRVTVIHQANAGVSAARNAGMDVAHGDYLAFFDPDDVMHPRLLETLHKVMPKGGEDGVIAMVMTGREQNVVMRETCDNVTTEDLTSDQVLVRMFGEKASGEMFTYWQCIGKLYPAKMLKGHRFPKTTHSEDALFNLPLYQRCGRVRYIGRRLYFYRPNANSATMRSTSNTAYVNMKTYPEMLKHFPDLRTEAAGAFLSRGMKLLIEGVYANRNTERHDKVRKLKKEICRQIQPSFISNRHVPLCLKILLLSFLHCMPFYQLFIWLNDTRAWCVAHMKPH